MSGMTTNSRRQAPEMAVSDGDEALLINERAAAKLLGISPRLLWSLRASGQIPFMRVGSRVLYSPKQLRDWVQSRLATTAALALP